MKENILLFGLIMLILVSGCIDKSDRENETFINNHTNIVSSINSSKYQATEEAFVNQSFVYVEVTLKDTEELAEIKAKLESGKISYDTRIDLLRQIPNYTSPIIDSVVMQLSPDDYQRLKRHESINGFSLELTRSGFQKLKAIPQVKSIIIPPKEYPHE